MKKQLAEGGEEGGREKVEEANGGEGGVGGGMECGAMAGGGEVPAAGMPGRACDASPAAYTINSSSQIPLPPHLLPLPTGRPLVTVQIQTRNGGLGNHSRLDDICLRHASVHLPS